MCIECKIVACTTELITLTVFQVAQSKRYGKIKIQMTEST